MKTYKLSEMALKEIFNAIRNSMKDEYDINENVDLDYDGQYSATIEDILKEVLGEKGFEIAKE